MLTATSVVNFVR